VDDIDTNNTERSHLNMIDIDGGLIDTGIAEDVSYIPTHLPHHILEDESSFQPPLEI
jgi:hypothetical protein